MNNYWHTLHDTVLSSIQTGRIGTPTFVRWTVVLSSEEGADRSMSVLLSSLVNLTSNWLTAQPIRLFAAKATGETESMTSPKHKTVAVDFENGAGALIVVSCCGQQTHSDLNLLGSHGSIVQKEFIEPQRDGRLDSGDGMPQLVQAIKRSLDANAPCTIDIDWRS